MGKSKAEIYGDVFTNQKSARLWNDLYDNPSDLFSHNMAQRRDRICQFVVDRYAPDTKILDLGCGAGVVMEKLIQEGFSVTGVDRSEDMLELSRQRLSSFPDGSFTLKQGTCESIPFEDEEFDLVLCVGVFGYIDDVVGALLEIRRVLRPGGLLLMSVRNPYNTILSDPIKTIRFGVSKLLRKMPSAEIIPHQSSEVLDQQNTASSQLPPQFKIDILQSPRPLINGISCCGYSLDHFSGFGFGPFSFAGKSPLPKHWSIKISDFLTRAFDAVGLSIVTRYVGDVSIYIFTKTTDQS